MSQHFLLSAAARTLSLSVVARMSEDEARETFKNIRWSRFGASRRQPKCGRRRCSARCVGPDEAFADPREAVQQAGGPPIRFRLFQR